MSLTVNDILVKYSQPGSLDSVPLQNLEDLSYEAWNSLGLLITDKVASDINGQDVAQICDALRICNRRVLPDTDEHISDKFDLMLDVHRAFFCHSSDDSRVSVKSLQCLVNLLINQPLRMKLFVESNGITRLCLSLKHYTVEHYSESLLATMQYVVKIMFMIKSCSECMSVPNVSLEDQVSWITSCVFVLSQLHHLLVLPSAGLSCSAAAAAAGLFCDVCKLLYSLDCYSVLEGITWSDTSFLSVETSADSSGSDCSSVLLAEHSEGVVGTRLSTITVLSRLLFNVLMLGCDSSSSISNSDSGDCGSGGGGGSGSASDPLDRVHQSCLQLCMLASQSTIDSMLLMNEGTAAAAADAASDSASGDNTTADGVVPDDAPSLVTSSGSGDILGNSKYPLPLIVEQLCSLLRKCLLAAANISGSSSSSSSVVIEEQQTTLLSPVLVFFSKLIHHNTEIRREFKRIIFPTPFVKRQGEQSHSSIDPSDVPQGSLRGLLVPLMISLNTQVKRCVAEFIYELCDKNVDEFVFRTGFGNAVALLQIKGLL